MNFFQKIILRTYTRHSVKYKKPSSKYDVIIVGGGHNGLVCAAYLQKAGHKVCVLERRHIIGGAAVTEEIIPNFKFSRASYVLSLLRPHIYKDLQLEKHGLKVYPRNPNLYTPLSGNNSKNSRPMSLLLGRDEKLNREQIGKFSSRDAEMYPLYEVEMMRIVSLLDPLLDVSAAELMALVEAPNFRKRVQRLLQSKQLIKTGKSMLQLLKEFPVLYEYMTAPASKILGRWFESEPLKATLATDAIIGAMVSPHSPGSGYVLLHHMMGEINGMKGAWCYPEGGMGAVSDAIATAAKSYGAEIFTESNVTSIECNNSGRAVSIITSDGREIQSKVILSNATYKTTFLELLNSKHLPENFKTAVEQIDYSSPVTKINVALSKLPNFLADPNISENALMPHHQCTINLNCDSIEVMNKAYEDARSGKVSERPLIEMVIPSSLDPTIAPKGCHVCLLFTQYTPYTLASGEKWNDHIKEEYANKVFDNIEIYAPGFKKSVIGKEVLSPPDLEKIFGLTGGNIFHGAITPDQLLLSRPIPGAIGFVGPDTPISGLFMCGSGIHPGGGVMGAPGYIAAQAAHNFLSKK